MRGFLIFLALAGLSLLYYWQKHQETPAAGAPKPATTQTVPSQSTASRPTAEPPREVSEHNWMKRSLDRATDVRNKARAQTQESQDP